MGAISIPERDQDAAYEKGRQREVDACRIVDGLTFSEYLKDPQEGPSLSSGIAHLIVNKSALHAWTAHPRLNPDYRSEESDVFDYGTAAHALLLEGSEEKLVIIEADDWRKKEAKELRDKARAERKTPILARQIKKLRRMVETAKAAIEASEVAEAWADGKSEQTLIWQENVSKPIYFRARADRLSLKHRICFDYKSAENANPDAFIRNAPIYGYTMQEAIYRRGLRAITGSSFMFVFLIQEKEPPFACSLVAFDPAMQEMGDRQCDYAVQLWTHAVRKNEWPGYSSRIYHMEPPIWYANRAAEVDVLLESGEQA